MRLLLFLLLVGAGAYFTVPTRAAHEEAAREGKGVVVVDGRLVESLHVIEARRQVQLAEAIAALAG